MHASTGPIPRLTPVDLYRVPTTDLRSFVAWMQASVQAGRRFESYAFVSSMSQGWEITRAELHLNRGNADGRALEGRLTDMAQSGDFNQAEFELGERWIRVRLEWANTAPLAESRLPITNAVVQAKSADEVQDEFCRLEAELRKHLPEVRKPR